DISVFFLFSPPRRTPSSTVFPYTTLFRSLLAGSMVADFGEDALNDGAEVFQFSTDQQNPNSGGRGHDRDEVRASNDWADHLRKRSEEHTSELQSLAYLVCRLLLEKKKKKL